MSTLLTRRHKAPEVSESPERTIRVGVTLPVIVMTVQVDGTMTVAVDNDPFPPPEFAPAWRRPDFAQIINEVMFARRSPVRVALVETDGMLFTDIFVEPLLGSWDPEFDEAGTPRPLELEAAGGFAPEEEVAVALVLRHATAGPDGSARSVVEPRLLELSPTREVILLGRTSGTYHVERLS